MNVEKMNLVLGLMPYGADPESHMAAGPWCFAGREDKFPDWENRFIFAPEPLADTRVAFRAARAAQALCVNVIPRLAAYLSKDSGRLSWRYWQTLLAPWAINMAKQIIERGLRCKAMIRLWKDRELHVDLLPENIILNFSDERDFTLNGTLGIIFNHWLFSRLLECDWPESWQKNMLQPVMGKAPVMAAEKTGFSGRIKNILRDMSLALPFPRLKGMTVGQALLFSASLARSVSVPDHSLDLSREFNYQADLDGMKLPQDILPLFLAAIPRSLANLRHVPQRERGKGKSRLRVASIIAYEDARYRQKLAVWRERGNRLAWVQHGGNYGQIATVCDTEVVEYSQDVFFTWGWNRHGGAKGNFQPMPYPQIAAMKDSWHGARGEKALFVGTEMAAFGYRLDSRPTPLQFLAYRKAKADFFEALGSDLRKEFLYRPYFKLPGTFEDAEWIGRLFPSVNICRGPLLPHILGCRLLVLDHHGTTMLEAFTANVPTILYWNRAHWPLCGEADELLGLLEEAGIWHDTAARAARKARDVWRSAADWWRDGRIQKAVRAYCEKQALLPASNINLVWINKLWKI